MTRETRIWWASLAVSVLAHGLGAIGVRALPAREGRLDVVGARPAGADPEPAPMYLFTADVPAPVAEPAPAAPEPDTQALMTARVEPQAALDAQVQPPAIEVPAPELEASLSIGTEGGTPGARAVVPSTAEGEMVGQLFTRESPQLDLRETAPAPTPASDEAPEAKPAPARTEATAEAPPVDTKTADTLVPAPVAAPLEPAAPAMPAREAQEKQEAQKAQPEVTAVPSAGSAGGEAPKDPAREAQPAQAERAAQAEVQASAGAQAGGDVRPSAVPATVGGVTRPAGVQSDRDSDAFSVTRTGVFRNGRVEAGEGLEIRTVRPQFTLLTRVTAAPAAPRVRVVFGKDGRVKDAKITRSSGYALEIDEPVLAAVFNWRASGQALRDLPSHPGATLRLDLMVVLVR